MTGKYGWRKKVSAHTLPYTRCDFFDVCQHRREQNQHMCDYKTDLCEFRRDPRIKGELERKLKAIIRG